MADSSQNNISADNTDKEAVGQDSLKLDYTLESAQERNELVKKIVEQTPQEKLTPQYLTYLSDYIIFAMDKEERKQKKIVTENRLLTINKHETSYQGLVGKLENGEDGLFNMTISNDKNIIFFPKNKISFPNIAMNAITTDMIAS